MKKTLLVGLTVFALGIGWYYFSQSKSPKPLPRLLATIIEECRKKDSSPTYIRCIRGEKLKRLIQKQGVQAVMGALNDIFAKEPTVGGMATTSCHDLAHVVGELAAETSHNLGATVSLCTGLCSYGCVHGALLEGVRRDQALVSNPESLCKPLADRSYPAAQLVACQHGVGHGFAEIAKLDMHKALSLCDGFPGDAARLDCGRGVIMEIVDSPILAHPREPIEGDIPAFCAKLPGIYKASCFVNAGSREFAKNQDWQKSVENCTRVPNEWRDSCMSYLGQNAYFLLTASAGKVKTLCENVEQGVGPCISGVLEAIAYYHRVSDVKIMCDLTMELRKVCYSTYGTKLAFIRGEQTRNDACNDFFGEDRVACSGAVK